MNPKQILPYLLLFVFLILLCRSVESYFNPYCPNCGGRIVTAQVYADPNNSAGLGWVL